MTGAYTVLVSGCGIHGFGASLLCGVQLIPMNVDGAKLSISPSKQERRRRLIEKLRNYRKVEQELTFEVRLGTFLRLVSIRFLNSGW